MDGTHRVWGRVSTRPSLSLAPFSSKLAAIGTAGGVGFSMKIFSLVASCAIRVRAPRVDNRAAGSDQFCIYGVTDGLKALNQLLASCQSAPALQISTSLSASRCKFA